MDNYQVHYDLCSLFWAIFMRSLLLTLLGGWAAFALVGTCEFLSGAPMEGGSLPMFTATITWMVALLLGFACLMYVVFTKTSDSTVGDIIVAAYRGIKERYCPLVDYKS
jgi:hypothetical protein